MYEARQAMGTNPKAFPFRSTRDQNSIFLTHFATETPRHFGWIVSLLPRPLSRLGCVTKFCVITLRVVRHRRLSSWLKAVLGSGSCLITK